MFFRCKPEESTKYTATDIALILDMARGLFEAGVRSNKIEMPTAQPMLTPNQREDVMQRMKDDAAWIVSGGEPGDGVPPEIDE